MVLLHAIWLYPGENCSFLGFGVRFGQVVYYFSILSIKSKLWMSLYYFLVTFEVMVACALFIVGSYHGKLRILDIHARMVVNYSFNFHLTCVIFLFVSINYKSISNKGNLSEFIEG